MEKFEVILRGRSVNIRYTHRGNVFIPTGISTDPALFTGIPGKWISKDGIKNGKINKKLSELDQKAIKFFAENDVYPTADEFKEFIRTGRRHVHTFDSAWEAFVYQRNHRGFKSISTARNATYTRVKQYIDEMNPGMTLRAFTPAWANKWVDWLVKNKKITRQGYVGCLCNVIIAFLHYCDDHEIMHVPKLVFSALRQEEPDLDIFFHSTDELKMLLNKDLSRWPDLADTRDKYCCQCMLGMRMSDFFNEKLDPNSLVIKRAAIKTRETITIPVRSEARELIRRMLSREGGYREIPEPVYNKEIKEVGELCGLTDLVTMVHGKRKFKAGERYYKYELMSSHMARSTFICQMIEQNVHYKIIMSWTGIKDVNTLRKYAAVMDVTLMAAMEKVEKSQNLFTDDRQRAI